jgi:hypothetical protein
MAFARAAINLARIRSAGTYRSVRVTEILIVTSSFFNCVCALPWILSAAAEGNLEPSFLQRPPSRADPHRLDGKTNEPPVTVRLLVAHLEY